MFESTWKNIALSLLIIIFGVLYLFFWEFFVKTVLGLLIILLGVIGLIVTIKESSGNSGSDPLPDYAKPKSPPEDPPAKKTNPQPETVNSEK
jgi:hypothetical protein